MDGINNTKTSKKYIPVSQGIGRRLQALRENSGFRGSEGISNFLERANEKKPIKLHDLTWETYRKWESGHNSVNIEWIPTLCELLHCEVGYLFGEFDQPTKEITDICAKTAL